MVEIISKRSEPSDDDLRLRHVLKQNRSTIHALTKVLTGGEASPSPAPIVPSTSASASYSFASPSGSGEARPYVRISMNGRVVLVDYESGRQMAHLGDVRSGEKGSVFRLASRRNGAFAPLSDGLELRLLWLDGCSLTSSAEEQGLKERIAGLLGFQEYQPTNLEYLWQR